jgi:hypothetical protein
MTIVRLPNETNNAFIDRVSRVMRDAGIPDAEIDKLMREVETHTLLRVSFERVDDDDDDDPEHV